MKANAQLQKDVIDELHWETATRDSEIGVSAKDGVVTLSGQVSSYSKKLAAETATKRVFGVQAVASDITVKLPTSFERSDTELAHAAVHAMEWDIDVPDSAIQLKVENGWITLEGSVKSHFERQAAENAVRNLTGVRGITNRIMLQPAKVKAEDVSIKITSAFKRAAELDASRILVDVDDGRVTLKGHVRSWAERMDAERAAWSAPGVKAIDDKLVVAV